MKHCDVFIVGDDPHASEYEVHVGSMRRKSDKDSVAISSHLSFKEAKILADELRQVIRTHTLKSQREGDVSTVVFVVGSSSRGGYDVVIGEDAGDGGLNEEKVAGPFRSHKRASEFASALRRAIRRHYDGRMPEEPTEIPLSVEKLSDIIERRGRVSEASWNAASAWGGNVMVWSDGHSESSDVLDFIIFSRKDMGLLIDEVLRLRAIVAVKGED